MKEKKEIESLVARLVSTFDLQATSRDGVIEGELLVDKLTDFIFKTTKVSLEERKDKFKETLKPYLEKYGREMLNDFYFHWTATKEGGWKMKVERETSWDLPKRLNTWSNNAIKFRTLNILNGAKK